MKLVQSIINGDGDDDDGMYEEILDTIKASIIRKVMKSLGKNGICRVCGTDQDVCRGCGYCIDHHYLDPVGRAITLTDREVRDALGFPEKTDDEILNEYFSIEREKNAPTNAYSMFACRLWSMGVSDLSVIEKVLIVVHDMADEAYEDKDRQGE